VTQVIADLPRDERPRERMVMHGPETLSDAELLAIFLGSGKRGKNAIELSRELLSDGIRSLSRREMAQLTAVSGIGPAKAARLLALFEFARRFQSGEPEQPAEYDQHVLGRSLIKHYARHTQERLGAVALDSRHRIVRQKEIFVGTTNSALVSTGDIIKFALLENATALVLYHNHPSGNPAPSAEDESFTRKLKYSLSTADIELLDHLIIGSHGYFSMKERGLL
jgi:DNA repair protein RadC